MLLQLRLPCTTQGGQPQGLEASPVQPLAEPKQTSAWRFQPLAGSVWQSRDMRIGPSPSPELAATAKAVLPQLTAMAPWLQAECDRRSF